MKKPASYLAAAVWLLALRPAQAQPTAALPTSKARAAMGEDIEIMRRLLNRELLERRQHGCAACHTSATSLTVSPDSGTLLMNRTNFNTHNWQAGLPHGIAFSPDGRILATSPAYGNVRLWDAVMGKQLGGHQEAHIFAAAEGVYLDGHGVVYTLTLTGPVVDSATLPVRPSPQKLDEWDRIRGQLHGSKPEAVAPAAEPREPPLREVLLKLLARHGHRFTQLGPRETLTVAVIFREPPPSATEAKPPAKGTGAGGTTTSGKPAGGDPAAQPATSRDYELLGDLHLKQLRAKEAWAAYGKAVSARPSGDDVTRRRLYRKFAQATLAYAEVAPTDRTEQLLAGAAKLLQLAIAPAAKTAPAAAPPTRLPARLIVSASKALLDQVAAGKITFEEFRRGASVEFIPAATVDKGAAPKAP